MTKMGIPENLQVMNPYNKIQMNKSVSEKDADILERLNARTDRKEIYRDVNKKEMGKNDFLKLLAHQMQHQDPLKPMDQTKFIQDMAQFSQLEQLTNINNTLSAKESRNLLEERYFAGSFLGKKVTTSGNDFYYYGDDTKSKIFYSVPQNAKMVRLRIFDQQQNLVGQYDFENVPKGLHDFSWDGTMLDKGLASKGRYTFQVQGWDEAFGQIEVNSQTTGVVEAVNFENGQIFLVVDGKKIELQNISSLGLTNKEEVSEKNLSPKKLVERNQTYDNRARESDDRDDAIIGQ